MRASTTYWLRADFSLQCGWRDGTGVGEWTAEYARVRAAAVVPSFCTRLASPFSFLVCCWRAEELSQAPSASSVLARLPLLGTGTTSVGGGRVGAKLFFVSLVRLGAGTLSQLLVALFVALSLLVHS